MATDNLGITELENKQIDALTLGVPRELISNATRQPIEEVPQLIPEESDYEVKEANQDFGSDYEDYLVDAVVPKEASKKALYASLANRGDVVQDFNTVYNDLLTQGNSYLLEGIQGTLVEQGTQEFESDVLETALAGDSDGLSELLQAAPEVIREAGDPKLRALKLASEAATMSSSVPQRSREQQIKYLEGIEDRSVVREQINYIINAGIADTSLSLPTFYADGFSSGFTGDQMLRLSGVGKDILGESYPVMGGNMFRDLAQHVLSLPLDKQEAEVEKIVDSITNQSGLIGAENDIVKVFALETFNNFMNAPGGDIPSERIITNIFGAVDILGFLPVATGVRLLKKVAMIRKSPSALTKTDTMLGEIVDANPDLGGSLQAAALKNPEVAEKLSTTQGDALAKALPGSTFDDDIILQGAPNSFKDKFLERKTAAQEALEFVDNTYTYAPVDYKSKVTRMMEIISDEDIAVFSKPSMASYSIDDNSNTLKAVFGDETDMPLSLEKATKVKTMVDERLAKEGLTEKSQLIVKNEELGTYEKFDPSIHTEDSNFLVSANFKMKLKDITKSEDNTTKAVGGLGRLFLPPQSRVDLSLLKGARVASDAKFFSRHDLVRIANPFMKINYRSKRRVASLLDAGENFENEAGEIVGKTFSYDELVRKGYSDKEAEAYFSARLFNDAVYRFKNSDYRSTLDEQGFKGLTVQRGEGNTFTNAVRPLEADESLPENVKAIFDPFTSSEIKVSEKSLQELSERGMVIGKTLQRIDNGAKEYSYVAVKATDIHDLPANVVPYRRGYNYRINNDPYYIDQHTVKSVDGEGGKKSTRTVKVARNRFEAEKTLKALQQEFKDEDFEIRLDRKIASPISSLQADIDTLDGSGIQLWFSKRGDRLRRQDGSVSSVEDPISAIQQLSSSIANVGTHREFLDAAIMRHRKTYGNVKVDGINLWSFDRTIGDWKFNLPLAKEAGRDDVKRAVNEYRYIEHMKFSPTSLDIKWKDFLEGMDQFIAKGGETASKVSKKVLLDSLAATNPGSFARGVTFSMTIPLRPLRHIVLQGTTGMHLFGIDPIGTLESFGTSNLLMMSMATYSNPLAWSATKKLSKLWGYSDKEWEETFKYFRKSGKAYSIDSNVAVGELDFSWSRSMPETYLGEAWRLGKNIAKLPITGGKAVGFDLGEFGNQAMTWVFTKKQWQKKNPGKDWTTQRAQDEINAAARNYSVDMTRTDQLPYQQGAFATMTQFLAINNKMAIRAIGLDPEIREHQGRYLLGMATMYGASGVGMHEVYDQWKKESGIEVHPIVDDVLYGGFSQAMLHITADLAFGNPVGTTRTAFADSFSPAAGIVRTVPDFVGNLMDRNWLEAISGPSGTIFPNLWEAGKYIKDIWGFDSIDTHEKLIESMQVAAESFGMFSDIKKYNMAMAYKEKLDEMYVVGKDGRPTAMANAATEQWMKMLLGLQLRSEKELYNVWLEKNREYTSTGKENVAQIDKDVKHMNKYIYEAWATTDDPYEFAAKARAITFDLHRGNRPYGLDVMNKAMSAFKNDAQFGVFADDVVEKWALTPEANMNKIKNYVTNSDYIPEEDKPLILNHIDLLEISKKQSAEYLDKLFPETAQTR